MRVGFGVGRFVGTPVAGSRAGGSVGPRVGVSGASNPGVVGDAVGAEEE